MRRGERERGFSVVTILGVSLVAGLWITAMAALVVPSYTKAVQGRQINQVRSASEAALDWAVDTMCEYVASGNQGTNIDDSTPGDSSYQQVSVPSNVLGIPGATALVTVKNVPASPHSSLYDSRLAVGTPQSQVQSNGWRVVSSTATLGGRNKTVTVLLKPMYSIIQVPGTPTQTTVPIFNFAMFADGGISLSGNQRTDSYDSRLGPYGPGNKSSLGGDIGSNTSLTLSGNSDIGGSVKITSPHSQSQFVVDGSGQTVVHGSAQANGQVNEGAISVLNEGGASQAVSEGLNDAKKVLPPVPTAPANATNLGAVSLSGTKSLTLSSGDYIMSSLSMSGQSKININVSGNNPVNIYIQGSGANFNLSGQGIAFTGAPKNVRIWYAGSNDINITGNANFTGVLYAPNANVKLAGNGQAYGAVVGKQVTMSGGGNSGGFHYDRALGSADANLNTVVEQATVQSVTTLTGYQTVSWQEN